MASRVTRNANRKSPSSSKATWEEPSQKRRKSGTVHQGEDSDKDLLTKTLTVDELNSSPRRPAVKYDDDVLLGRDEVVTLYVDLDPLPARTPRVPEPTQDEVRELEHVLELVGKDSDSWRADWAGNLALVDKEICNPKVKEKPRQAFRQPLLDWARKNPDAGRLVWNLIRYVIHFQGTPDGAKKVLSAADPTSLKSLETAIRRTAYDPIVLQQDGWLTAKSSERVGATGGPNLIGDIIRWQHYDAVVIAYDHDEQIGDLWKAMWIDHDEGGDFVSFDVEAEELLEAKRKWERRQQRLSQSGDAVASRRSARYTVSADFSVKGIEQGVVMAASLSKGARPGVFWPARVMHVSESLHYSGKRSSSKLKVDVMFLAPYWNSDDQQVRTKRIESLYESGSSAFSSGSLFQFESVDATEDMIRDYPHDGHEELDINKLRTTFRFTGLPRAAFPRFLDSHRLALCLRAYARRNLTREPTETEKATAGLFDCHPMAVRTASFPSVVLNLPFEYILSQLPHPDGEYRSSSQSDNGYGEVEPILKLETIVEAMRPPQVFGIDTAPSPRANRSFTDRFEASTPRSWSSLMNEESDGAPQEMGLEHFFTGLDNLNEQFSASGTSNAIASLIVRAKKLFAFVIAEKRRCEKSEGRKPDSRAIMEEWVNLKRHGVDVLTTVQHRNLAAVSEWRRASERLYKYITSQVKGFDDTLTVVLTDFRCNGHITSSTCFERCVRLPAAMKAVKLAGASKDGSPKLVTEIQKKYVDLVENSLLAKVHSAPYLKRMKSRCAATRSEEEVVMLTDDSDGAGGEDTMGSRGTWAAAVCGVAAAVAGVEMIVAGECVNVFCATRPPGHHAGRNLHPMKAVSNGFCVLNAVASAAIYATTPHHEGGLGLSRVCVIDFDAHHGNGTQDILCSTYDSRYLYVSLHAGGPEVNGVAREEDDDPNHELHDLATNKSGGIFPGRCGDTSPHKGVVNVPLGARVTAHDVGNALIRHVSPAVESFAPDLIILSAGFDAHKNDPMSLGALSAEDFGHITEVTCQLAFKTCSGRVLSVLEGGYGVPCCRPQRDDLFLPPVQLSPDVRVTVNGGASHQGASASTSNGGSLVSSSDNHPLSKRPQPSQLLDLGEDLPGTMEDQVPYGLQKRLEKCHSEGFIQCVQKHVEALSKCSKRR